MNDFFNRYLDNNCSDADFDSAIDLMLSPGKRGLLNKQMKEHWDNTTGENEVSELSNILHKVHHQINKKEKVKKVSFITYFSRIAAILILPLCLALVYIANENYSKEARMQTIFSPLASRTSFDLPDGSKVWLNAGSSLSFPDKFNGSARTVKLTGQAYFDVEKDNVPFEIETDNLKVNVLGTAFDVSAYKGEAATVTLVRGKVNVESCSGSETELNPGEQAFFADKEGTLDKREVNSYLCTAWKDNLLVFDDERFEDALPRLERWYNVDLVLGDERIKDKNIRINGTFQYEGISEILQLMEITNSIIYTHDKEERQIILKLK